MSDEVVLAPLGMEYAALNDIWRKGVAGISKEGKNLTIYSEGSSEPIKIKIKIGTHYEGSGTK